MITIDFFNKSSIYVDQVLIQNLVEDELKKSKIFKPVELAVLIVGDGKIRELNKKYRGMDKVTDVLSFPTEEQTGADGIRHLGDIIICAKEAVRRGENIDFLVLHGLAHLLGRHHD